MRLTDNTKKTLLTLMALNFPEDVYMDIGVTGMVNIQAYTQDEVRRARSAFGGGIVWKKAYSKDCAWWEYSADVPQGMSVYIYACREAPAQCKAIEEIVEVEEQVPVAFERRTVKKTVVRWDCPETAEVTE